ncbi:MAG: hypothetical protein ACRC92_26615 [Peptostreptococcaceae bacterium]
MGMNKSKIKTKYKCSIHCALYDKCEDNRKVKKPVDKSETSTRGKAVYLGKVLGGNR